jgi:hypothetical protein
MADSANVRSISALRDAKAAVERFVVEATNALSELETEIRRGIDWLATVRVPELEREIRRMEEAVQDARKEYRRKEFTSMSEHPSLVDERKALDRAKAKLEETRERLERTRRWVRTLEKEWVVCRAQTQPLVDALQRDLPLGCVRLTKMTGSLEAYARLAAPDGSGESAPAAHLGSDETLAPPAQPGSLAERLRLLRRATPSAGARAGLEIEDGQLAVARPGTHRVSARDDLLTRLGLTPVPVDPSAKVVLAEGCLDEAVIYLERVATQEPGGGGDSGWFIGPGDGAANVSGYAAASVQRVSTIAPGLDVLMQLPPGWLVLVVGGEVEAVVTAEHKVVYTPANAGGGVRNQEGRT